ncbi:RidA family protein [Pseudorhodoplanes sp.]|uniref:RidA family protein n=1 Tax=Pseudorhodoplanes sp. TaxID=1934341 RepID=UPI003D0FBA03
MKKTVETKLWKNPSHVSGGVIANGILYTAVIPRKLDGSVEVGAPEKQIRLALDNLKHVVESAGGTLQDVTQVICYLTDTDQFDLMIGIYKEYFADPPFPSRATIIPAKLAVDGMIIELVAQAHISTSA